MNKILLIIQREYTTRVRKKSFWIASLLVPILIAAVYAIPLYLFLNSNDTKTIEVVDESKLFKGKLQSEEDITFKFIETTFEQAKKNLYKSNADIVVNIPKDILDNPNGVKMVGKKSIGLSVQFSIQGKIQNELRNIKLQRANIDLKVLEENKVNVNAKTYTLDEDGGEQSSSSTGAMILAGIFGMILYISAFLYG